MAKTIFFHIGTVKTGSTYLQRTMWEDRALLESLGVTYLGVTPPALHLPRWANADFLDDPALHDTARRLIEEAPADRILISEEGWFARPELIAHPLFDGFDKRVIVYIRRPAELVAAWAAENAEPYNAIVERHGSGRGPVAFERGIEDFAREYADAMRKCFRQFDALGPEMVTVRPFEREALRGGDLLTDFLSVLGIDAATFRARASADPDRVINPTRSRKFCDVSTLLWERYRGRDEQADYGLALVERVVERCDSGDPRPPVETLTDAEILRLTEELAFVETEIASRGLVPGSLFLSRFPAVYGREREPYRPVSVREAELLDDLYRLERTLARERDRVSALTAERDRLAEANGERERLAAALAQATADLARVRAERDRAIRYPWKYFGQAWRVRRRPAG